MNLVFCGDTHGKIDHVFEALAASPTLNAVQLGDMAPLPGRLHEVVPAHCADRFWFIPGNHEFESDEAFDNVHDTPLADRNLHARVAEIDGVRVAGLGGVFMGSVWHPRQNRGRVRYRYRTDRLHALAARERWRGGLPRRMRQAIWKEDVDALARQRADVLVTHEAPSCHRFGFREIDELANRMRVGLIVHGHQHMDYADSVYGGRIRVLGVGLRGVARSDGTVLRPGEAESRAS